VIALVTQFGGGKTHTLTALFHIISKPTVAFHEDRIKQILRESGLSSIPSAKVAVFVGDAWDPQPNRETPWQDIAYQIAGQKGLELLGAAAKTVPPGTQALTRLFREAGSVLILMDEVLNFLNRHRDMAEQFYAYLDNLVRATTGITGCVAVISFPRSQVEMTKYDQFWQERITKAIRRVARELIVNEEGEIAEVVRRRLFEDLGPETARAAVAKAYAEWCFDRSNQLPSEWTAVDSTTTDAKAKEFLRKRFESCYPFHPATLSVFQRKWQTLPQYQQTRGTLAMLAQWIAWVFREGPHRARKEALVTLGSTPWDVSQVRDTILGQLGEPRLIHAVEVDIAGETSHARALDEDTKGNLENIHRRVGSAILFESSGGMVDKVAHLPDIRFAIGEPGIDTTSIDNAVFALERKGFYLRKAGKDAFRFGFQATMKKVVGDRRASLDEEEVRRAVRKITKDEWEKKSVVPVICFPREGSEVGDLPRLTIVVVDPERTLDDDTKKTLQNWTTNARLYPAAIVWALRKPGRDLNDKVELYLAWKRVIDEISSGLLGEYETSEKQDAKQELLNAEDDAHEEVWASYQFALLYDKTSPQSLRVLTLGAGHTSAGGSLTDRIITAMKSESLLNESVGAGYLQRNWPTSLKETGSWPLSGMRQSFLDGSLPRLLNPEQVLTAQVVKFVSQGEFGVGVGRNADGTFERVWYKEAISPEEITFDSQTYLILQDKAQAIKSPAPPKEAKLKPQEPVVVIEKAGNEPDHSGAVKLHITGAVPPELWNKIGTRLIPKLRSRKQLELTVAASLELPSADEEILKKEVKQILSELGLNWSIEQG
jgi:hypothetical protein